MPACMTSVSLSGRRSIAGRFIFTFLPSFALLFKKRYHYLIRLLDSMKKYIYTLKISLQKVLTYRSRELIWTISNFVTPFIFIQIWANNKGTTGNFSPDDLVTYYFASTIIAGFVTPHILWNVANDINKGELNFYFLKPYKYFFRRLSEELPWTLIAIIFNLLPSIFIYILYKDSISIPTISHFQTVVFVLSLILSYLISFFVQFTIGLCAFWITEVRSIMRAFSMSYDLFSGRMFPLSFMPRILISLGNILPFQYLLYFPTMIVLNKYNNTKLITGIGVMFLWTIVLGLISSIVWKKGIKTYSAFGG